MSGIYGVYNDSYKTEPEGKVLNALSRWNLAYGDGGNESFTRPGFGMGICEQHLTNAPANANPVIRRGQYAAVIDAVLYNRDKLRVKYQLSDSLSDEEMLLECVLTHGYTSLAEVNGDFCGAVFDTESRELILFRDHMGVRPLFYYRGTDWLAFSTDIRGLIAIPDMPADVNEEWLYRMVCGYDTADYVATEIKDVFL